MKDERGLYYYPNPKNRNNRMYVRENDGVVEFRLWAADDPQVWEKHPWAPMEMIKQAASVYEKKDMDPLDVYDEQIARRLIQDDRG